MGVRQRLATLMGGGKEEEEKKKHRMDRKALKRTAGPVIIMHRPSSMTYS